MRKPSLIILLISVLLTACGTKAATTSPPTPSVSQKEVEFTFRKTHWGMTQDQVKESETLHNYDGDESTLIYTDVINNKDVSLTYNFVDDKLVNALYTSLEKHENKNLYIDDYNAFKVILVEKYGEPTNDVVKWRSDTFKNRESDYGLAVSTGHLAYAASWETPDTDIGVILTGDNFEISLSIIYQSKKLKDLWNTNNKEENKL